MSHASVYSSGPLRGRPIRGAKGAASPVAAPVIRFRPDEPTGVRIDLSAADMDDWRDKVVWADFGGATAGDQALNDAAIDAVIPADAPAPPVDWHGGRRRPRLGLPLTVILIGLAVTYFAWRIAA